MRWVLAITLCCGCASSISLSHAQHLIASCQVSLISFVRRGAFLTLHDHRAIRYGDTNDDRGDLVQAVERAEPRCGRIGILVE